MANGNGRNWYATLAGGLILIFVSLGIGYVTYWGGQVHANTRKADGNELKIDHVSENIEDIKADQREMKTDIKELLRR